MDMTAIMAICRNLASPKRRLMVGLRRSWSLRLRREDLVLVRYDQTSE